LALSLTVLSCTSYNAFQHAKSAEVSKDWDAAVADYQKALDVDPSNKLYQISLSRAKLEASRVHFEKAKSLRASASNAKGSDQTRLLQMAATELELVIKLDTTNQYAAVEYGKTVNSLQELAQAGQPASIDEIKRRAKANITKSKPPELNPTSDQPISLSFPHETPIKEIYKALGNAFGINILFDQAVKDDRIAIELKDVTAQQALERVMQAANHFYKALDEHTIIVVPDNPQARRDYEDLVIRTFYLSNGDAEQVTNVVRTMIEARNVFPLKALNAITIRDTADKVRIAEKIIEANDKAKSEVVVDVELLQIDLDKQRDMGAVVNGLGGTLNADLPKDKDGNTLPANLDTLRGIRSANLMFTIPSISYNMLKSVGNTETLANPELRISEGEKATLHIGQRVPVPVTTFVTGVQSGTNGNLPATSFQYQDIGIKVSIEPRVHHNREVTLKLTVEVSDIAAAATADAPPAFNTRTIEATIRLKDGETNFLAGLIQDTKLTSSNKTPFLGDIPILGRLFTKDHAMHHRTDLMLTMTPHIIRIPDITEDDMAPMWVGTQSNLSFRGLSPRLESQSTADPFTARSTQQFNAGTLDPDGNPIPAGNLAVPQGSGPNDPFRGRTPNAPPTNPATPPPAPTPQPQSQLSNPANGTAVAQSIAVVTPAENTGLSPRVQPQPMRLSFKPGEEKLWNVVGMDLDGLTTQQLLLHYNPQTIDVTEIIFGPALVIDPKTPPIATIDREHGTVRITSSNGKPLQFNNGGGDIASLRVRGGAPGDTYLVLDNPNLTNATGTLVNASVSGGHAKVD
jgi:general secretion pathway protein D